MRRSFAVSALALLILAAGAGIPVSAAPATPAAEADSLLAKARDAVDSNHLAEAIRAYISVIAISEESPGAETKERAGAAAAELAKIGTRLSIEPSGEWMDSKGTQIASATRSLGKPGAIYPAVYLFESFGSGKAPVADAPIFFEFAKNSGSLVSLVTTDAYGKANTTIARLDEPGKDAVVRAYPLFRSRGKAYAFKSVFRDFSYLPPANVAQVLALESSELGASENPQVVDRVIGALKPLGIQMLPVNAKLDLDRFRKAFSGDRAALAALGARAESPYTVFALVEISEIRQQELNGKKFNIFTSWAAATLRIVRQDGTVVLAIPMDRVKGQGGSREAAVADGYRVARDALVSAIQDRLPAIKEALAKE